ncbi:MFS transporter [Salinifilum ghardaiensis]
MREETMATRLLTWPSVLCWVTVMLEGYDLVVLGAIIPVLLDSGYLGFTPASATAVATLSLVGVAIGAASVGPLADRFGRRPVLMGSVVLFSVLTLVLPLAPSVAVFAALRLLAGIGLGACMPAALTIMSEYLPAAQRARANTITMTGYHAGAVLTSLLALLAGEHWSVLFYALGLAGLGVVVLMWFLLPESEVFTAVHADSARVGFRDLLNPRLLRAGIGVWVGSFMGLLLVYGLNTWLPELMRTAGYNVSTSVGQLLVLNVGAVVGLVFAGFVADRRGIKPTILVWFAISAVLLALLSIRMESAVLLHVAVFVTGVFVFSAQVLIFAYVAQFYPDRLRGTALGFTSGIGRFGAITGPFVTGALVTAGIAYPYGFYFFAAIAVCGVLAVSFVPLRSEESAVTG